MTIISGCCICGTLRHLLGPCRFPRAHAARCTQRQLPLSRAHNADRDYGGNGRRQWVSSRDEATDFKTRRTCVPGCPKNVDSDARAAAGAVLDQSFTQRTPKIFADER